MNAFHTIATNFAKKGPSKLLVPTGIEGVFPYGGYVT